MTRNNINKEFPEKDYKAFVHELAESFKALYQIAVREYTPIVEDFCSPFACPTKNEVECMLDKLFDFAGDERILLLYKKICRRYWEDYPETISFYIMEYRKEYDRESLVGTKYEYLLEDEEAEEFIKRNKES